MNYQWVITNVHEEKSYIITNNTLIGIKEYCEIKLWGTNVNENDIRFKIKENKYVSMKIFRKEIKEINIKINHRPVQQISSSLRLYNNTYFSIESYIFRVTRICVAKGEKSETLLQDLTKNIVQKFQTSKKHIKCKKNISKVKPNISPLYGKYVNGQMIVTNQSEGSDTIDLTV